MRQNTMVAALLILSASPLVGASRADLIGGDHLAPSTSLEAVDPWVVSQIADGITSDAPPFNGFVSNAASGTITLGLDQTYDLNGFVLWNDLNVFREGIAHFRLDFFDDVAQLLGSSIVYQAPIGQLDAETYLFDVMRGVRSVDLVVLDSNQGIFTRIEIREVAFLSVPEPSSFAITACGLLGLAGWWKLRRGQRSR